VFISYSAKDKTTADGVCATLETKGIRCWIAPRDILPGMDWGEAIIEAINGSRVIVLVFSSNANDSQQIKREVERAVSKGLPIIPLRIENVAPARSLEYFGSCVVSVREEVANAHPPNQCGCHPFRIDHGFIRGDIEV
jgi:TIR domain